MKHRITILLLFASFFAAESAKAVEDYNIGSPTLTEIWVDPVNGLDRPGRGTTRSLAYKTVHVAWASIPDNKLLTNTGFVIMLVSGSFSPDDVSPILQSVWGTYDY